MIESNRLPQRRTQTQQKILALLPATVPQLCEVLPLDRRTIQTALDSMIAYGLAHRAERIRASGRRPNVVWRAGRHPEGTIYESPPKSKKALRMQAYRESLKTSDKSTFGDFDTLVAAMRGFAAAGAQA